MSFLRHEEIYRSDVRLGQRWERQPVSSLPVLIGCDEFPVGYSLAGCPPAEPASASPTGDNSQQPTLPYNDFSANGNNPLNFVSQPKGTSSVSMILNGESLATVWLKGGQTPVLERQIRLGACPPGGHTRSNFLRQDPRVAIGHERTLFRSC